MDPDVTAASAGDVPAFGRLVERCHGPVSAVAFAVTADLALAEDVTQEAFVAAWDGLRGGRLRDADKFCSWVCGVARNLARNAVRSRKRERVTDPEDVRPDDTAASALDGMIAREHELGVESALTSMPAEYREPLVLFYWEHQSIRDVAATLSITEQAAQKRISRARAYLRDGLDAALDQLGRRRRAAGVASVAIVAVVTSSARAAEASTGGATTTRTGGSAMSKTMKTLLAVGGVTAIAAVVAVAAAREPGARTARPATVAPRTIGGPVTRATDPSLPPAAVAPQGARDPMSDPMSDSMSPFRGSLPVPQKYQLTEIGPGRWAVNLAGGVSSAFVPDVAESRRQGRIVAQSGRSASAGPRRVRGRIVDGRGKPVAGAIVMIDGAIRSAFGELFAKDAAVSASDGTFETTLSTTDPVYAMAIDPIAGWTPVTAIPAGTDRVELELVAPGAVSIAGAVRRGGEGIHATLTIAPIAPGLELTFDTDPRGAFNLSLLPAGRYTIRATAAQLLGGGSSKATSVEVDAVAAGKPVLIDIAAGTLVVASARWPASLDVSTVEYFLVSGDGRSLGGDELRRRGRAGAVLGVLVGGKDLDAPVQLHDVAAGPHTLCVELGLEERRMLPVVCQQLNVAGATLEIEVPIPVSR